MAGKKTMEALMLRKKGFNCAQAVVLPFCEDLGLDRQTAMRATEGFGSGMGSFSQTCGALIGAVFAIGLKHSDGCLDNPQSKRDTYKICREITDIFKKECGSTFCYEIRGIETKKPLKSCEECVMIAAQTLEKMINEK